MAEKLHSKVAYFSMHPDNPLIQEQMRRDGFAAIYENGYLSITEGKWTLRIEQAVNIPLTLGGRAPFMIANALAACLGAFVNGVDIEAIRRGVRTFKPSAQQTPGRMNLFKLGNYHALVDYAHNPHGYEAVGGFVRNWQGERIGVIGGPGDRRDEDLIQLGRLSAQIFSRVIVKEDDDKRGRSPGEVADLIIKGILQENPQIVYEKSSSEIEAIELGLNSATEGSLVVILPESVSRALGAIQKRQLG
jgi:cyanophycin synthetase